MPLLEPVDLIVADPPYGISLDYCAIAKRRIEAETRQMKLF